MVLSEREYYGTIHLLVRSTDRTTHLFLNWMVPAEASATDIVRILRLPIGRRCELRRSLDQIMIGLSSEDQFPEYASMERWSFRQRSLFESRPRGAELPTDLAASDCAKIRKQPQPFQR